MGTREKFEFKKNQFYVFDMREELSKGNYTIKMAFKAPLTNDLAGLYRSTYKHKDGTNVYVFCRCNDILIIGRTINQLVLTKSS